MDKVTLLLLIERREAENGKKRYIHFFGSIFNKRK
jgi:hypothetical protein